MEEPLYRPAPKSGCKPMELPMKLRMLAELGSTGEEEMSLFQRLSEGNGRKPLRLAPCPVDMPEQLEVC